MSAAPSDSPLVSVLLLDLDGVLLVESGYHETLRRVVALVGGALGYPLVALSQETIDWLEAAGVTSEWDSSAICAALLMDCAWQANPSVNLPDSLPLIAPPAHGLEPPDFRAFAQALALETEQELPPLVRAERLLLTSSDARPRSHVQILRRVLRDARRFESSLTFRLVQECNLGSALFLSTYGRSSALDCQSCLLAFDRPSLSLRMAERLRGWSNVPGHAAVVFTNRPSRRPDHAPGPPEAELGVEAARVPFLPVAAMGPLAWAAGQRGLEQEALLKPSAVHALAALRLAPGEPPERAVSAAIRLGLDGQADARWNILAGAQVSVFEDAAKGLISALGAQQSLAASGIGMDLRLYGVTASKPKAEALGAAGARLFPDLEAALDVAWGASR